MSLAPLAENVQELGDCGLRCRGETSELQSGAVGCPPPCKPNPYHRHRSFAECGSAIWWCRSCAAGIKRCLILRSEGNVSQFLLLLVVEADTPSETPLTEGNRLSWIVGCLLFTGSQVAQYGFGDAGLLLTAPSVRAGCPSFAGGNLTPTAGAIFCDAFRSSCSAGSVCFAQSAMPGVLDLAASCWNFDNCA